MAERRREGKRKKGSERETDRRKERNLGGREQEEDGGRLDRWRNRTKEIKR